MNLLIDTLPESVEIHGTQYRCNADFRTCLRIILAFEDDDLTPQEKQIILLSNLYPDVPSDAAEAIRQANWFLNGGKLAEDETDAPHRLYSFAKDANFIFSAFRQTHGIDLQTAELHWWKFLALFMDLGSETTFCNLVSLRKRVKTGKATKEEKAAAREMGDVFEIEDSDNRTLEEKIAEEEFMQKVLQGQKR